MKEEKGETNWWLIDALMLVLMWWQTQLVAICWRFLFIVPIYCPPCAGTGGAKKGRHLYFRDYNMRKSLLCA